MVALGYVSSRCPSGFSKSYYTSCFRLTSSRTWLDARTECSNWGGWLVTIRNYDWNSYIHNNYAKDSRRWIGLNDIDSEGNWKWLSGSSSYTRWDSGEPNNANNEDCVEIATNAYWNDEGCNDNDKKRSGVCEINVLCPAGSYLTSVAYNNPCSQCPSGESLSITACFCVTRANDRTVHGIRKFTVFMHVLSRRYAV